MQRDALPYLIGVLSEGDAALRSEVAAAVVLPSAAIAVGDVYLASRPSQVVWYEVLQLACEGRVQVRAYTTLLKSGEYDYVTPRHLKVRVDRRLFARAKAQGFRTLRLVS